MTNESETIPPYRRVTVRIADAAALLSVSVNTLRDWVKAGAVPYWNEGGAVMFSVDALRTWAEDKATSTLKAGA